MVDSRKATRLLLCAFVATCFAVTNDHVNGQLRDAGQRDRGFDFNRSWQGNDWLNNTQNAGQEWQLGVQTQNTETGVLINSVTPGSAAARAGIKQGDLVVAVEGFQVGVVSGRLYDLADEINRRADDRGAVALLLQDHRSRYLDQVRVQLDSSSQTLRGTLVYRGRNSLPRDAIVTVQIQNVSRPIYQVRNGQTSFQADGQYEIPFEISYDPSYVYAQDIYQVRAFVTLNGRTILDTPQTQQVLTQGRPSNVRLSLEPLSQSRPGTALAGSNQGGNVVTAGYPNFNEIDDRITALYRRYLGRDPKPLEKAVFRSQGIVDRIDEFPLELMAAQEYFDRAGNNDRVWLDAVFREIVGKAPNREEFDAWMRRYESLRFSRMELLRQLNSQVR